MDNLRVVLIIAGLCVVGAIYIWDRLQSRKASRRQMINPAYGERRAEHPGIVISAKPKDDEIQAGLDELDGFFIDVEPDLDEDAPGEIFISRDPNVKPVRRPISESLAIPEQTDAFPDPEPQAARGTAPGPGAVITLFVVTDGDRYLSGPDIQTAVTALGFEFGEMNIFHHHGTGELAGKHPLFSLVNMYEPGYFEMDGMDSFQTHGLSIFTQLPMEQNPEIVFPYMLEITYRLAKRLGAEVLGPGRKPLDQATLDDINKLIGEYVR